MPMTAIVEVRDLRKRFGDVEAVAGLDFTIRRGEIFGLLGPNGAGKSTTIRLLLGLLRPDAGSIRIAGRELREAPGAIRRLIGWVPQSSTLDPLLTGREQFRVLAALYEVPDAERRVEEALARFGLLEAADRLIRHYSGGMKKRLELAAGTLHDPEILLLDEPTAALDVETRHQIWALIRQVNARGTTVVLTTHYLDEADLLCDRVAIIDRGRLLALDTPGLPRSVSVPSGGVSLNAQGPHLAGRDERGHRRPPFEWDRSRHGQDRMGVGEIWKRVPSRSDLARDPPIIMHLIAPSYPACQPAVEVVTTV